MSSENRTKGTPTEDFRPVERIILTLLAVEGQSGQRLEPVRGQTWLQKEVFVTLRTLLGDAEVRTLYQPHRAGMYSEEVDHLERGLISDGLVELDASGGLRLTSRGAPIAEAIAASGKHGVEIAREVKALLNGLDYPDLIIYVYSSFPGWDEASEVVHHMRDLHRRLLLATRLYRLGKVSAERAAQVAGIPLREFLGRVEVPLTTSR